MTYISKRTGKEITIEQAYKMRDDEVIRIRTNEDILTAIKWGLSVEYTGRIFKPNAANNL